MQRLTATLDKYSGYLFFIGFLTSKLKNIPIALVASVLNAVSLVAYLIGYVAWSIASFLYPNHPRKQSQWYGFVPFKQQYQMAALLGTLATVLCLTTSVLLAAAWLYTLSNMIWNIAEYHKMENPPRDDVHYSSTKQSTYFHYTLLVTITSSIAAIGLSIASLIPAFAVTTLSIASIVGTGFTIASLHYWSKCAFGTFPPDNPGIKQSYHMVQKELAMGNTTPKQLPKLKCANSIVEPEVSPFIASSITSSSPKASYSTEHESDDSNDMAPLLFPTTRQIALSP